ncbi:phage portal protein [Acuticoccus mangrovi]|uniref:Phage portal protein n=1 Tax=Acuticoccus mangrovi TaxID=2796142 RepID=A0A934IH62_9HYPH|nr:phage portal protein [Acuticoccus mangrovi]
MNITDAVDRAIAFIAPGAGARRIANRHVARTAAAMRGGHKGARRDRDATRTWLPDGGSPTADTHPDLPTLRARSRDTIRNDMIAGGAIRTVKTNVVGLGLVAKPTVDAEVLGLSPEEAQAWNREAARRFRRWAKTADFYGRETFAGLQGLAFRAVLESGDVFVLRRFDPSASFGLRLQVLEADHVRNPAKRTDTDRVRAGVQLDIRGRPEGYYVTDRHPGDDVRGAVARWRFVPRVGRDGAPLVLHLFEATRPGQIRGVPFLSPVLEALKQLGRFTDAELMAAVNSAMIVAFVTTQGDPDSAGAVLGSPDGAGFAAGVDTSGYTLENGRVVGLRPGETVDMKAPGRPNTAFEQFERAILREIGVALELPFELLIKHFEASYSASRAALEMAWQMFRERRDWLTRHLCQPVYEWWLAEAVARCDLAAPGFFDDEATRAAWCAAEWIGPSRMSLDPQKEAAADAADVALGVKTLDQVIAERTGGTFESKHEQRVREVAMRIAAGLEAPVAAATARAPAGDPESDDDGEARAKAPAPGRKRGEDE